MTKATGTLEFDLNDQEGITRFNNAKRADAMADMIDHFLDYLATVARAEAEATQVTAQELFNKIYNEYLGSLCSYNLKKILNPDIHYLIEDFLEAIGADDSQED